MMEQDFAADQRTKALTRWKWRNPYWVALLAFVHPLGMLLSSTTAFVVYLAAWIALFVYWPGRPTGTAFGLAFIFAAYAFLNTRWKNACIEKWKYGLPGTGMQNPKKLAPLQ